MKFSEQYKEMIGEERVVFTKKKYSWGELRKIEKGHSFSVIIHPEHNELVQRVIDGADDLNTFVDEQNFEWNVSLKGDNLVFKSDQGKLVTLPVNKYN